MTRSAARVPRLPYPTRFLFVNGIQVEEYIIPDSRRADVLKDLYIFHPVPALHEERFDLHAGKKFKVRDFRVTREAGHNFLVSPYYENGGSTVIGWMPVEAAEECGCSRRVR
jgi:hypothetical protein